MDFDIQGSPPAGIIDLKLVVHDSIVILVFACILCQFTQVGLILVLFVLDVESAISEKMVKEGSIWYCNDCSYQSGQKGHVYEHVEAKHVIHGGYQCQYCDKVLKSRASVRMHLKQYHPTS